MDFFPLKFDQRKNCFVTLPRSFHLNQNKLGVVQLQQGATTVYSTCSSETVRNEVFVGSFFAKINNLQENEEINVQDVSSRASILTRAVAEPLNEEDWEILELNAEQIQSQLLDIVRVVSKGARLPVWITNQMHISIKIIELEPECEIGILAPLTEVEVVPPKKKQHFQKISVPDSESSLNKLLGIIRAILPAAIENLEDSESMFFELSLRAHPMTDPIRKKLNKIVNSQYNSPLQPYMAFVSQTVGIGERDLCGKFEYQGRSCHGNVILLDNPPSEVGLTESNVLLSEHLLQQLHVELRDRVKVSFMRNDIGKEVEALNFYVSENEDIDLARKDIEAWLAENVSRELGLILNYGMNVSVPKTTGKNFHEIFTTFTPKSSHCVVNETRLEKLLKTFTITKFSWKNAPELLCKPAALRPFVKIATTEPYCAMEDVAEDGINFLTSALNLKSSLIGHGVSGCRNGNLLITGSRGSGRTSLARHLCSLLENSPDFVFCSYVDCASLKGKKLETLKRDWSHLFQDLMKFQPSVVTFDDLDLLASCPHDDGAAGISGETFYYTRVSDLLRELVMQTPYANQVMVIATAVNSKSLHPQLVHYKGSHLFSKEINIPPLNHTRRQKLFAELVTRSVESGIEEPELKPLCKKMDGFNVLDIKTVVKKATHYAVAESGSPNNVKICAKHIEEVLKSHKPFGLHGIEVKPPPESQKTWDDVGGLGNAKRKLAETMQWPAKYPELFSHCPIRMKSAILLYGAPGTGKTLLASAMAIECGMNFISVKGPELLSKYIGASEESVRETFCRARSAEPCILFFDEFDSLAPRRGHDSTGVTDRVVNQLLTELDGVEGQQSKLWVLAATSRPDLIDPALLRPGRFDTAVHCPLPDTGERLEILKSLSRRLKLEQDPVLEEMALNTTHFSGADLQALLYTAQLKAIHSRNPREGISDLVIRNEHLLEALNETQPSVSASERSKYQQIGTSKRPLSDQLGPARATLA